MSYRPEKKTGVVLRFKKQGRIAAPQEESGKEKDSAVDTRDRIKSVKEKVKGGDRLTPSPLAIPMDA